ncbi:hypothetical protein T4C_9970 [Trichinella pseudospiralis]|uniref:Uncharacterized protein n=1 Tax=Trichinella pseudospiralis TaxID=6337 RepID=A0A0V1J181_TRIPS|nr:hypothetical protein T4C_9970 [Trichinella pseudospiralis]
MKSEHFHLITFQFRTLFVEAIRSNYLIVNHSTKKVEKSKLNAKNKKREKTSSIPAIKQSATGQTRLNIINDETRWAMMRSIVFWSSSTSDSYLPEGYN